MPNYRENSTAPETSAPDWPLRPVSFFLSLFVHAAIVSALAYLPAGAVQPEKPVRLAVYKMLDLKKEPVTYWAPVPAALPAVSPETPIGDSRAFRGEELSRNEQIVVQKPGTDPSKQLVWQPDKPELLQREIPLQNMVTIQGKAVPKPFEPPKSRVPVPEPPKMLTAPETQTAKVELPANVAGLPSLPAAKPKPRMFVPPKEQPRLVLAAGAVSEAPPELEGAAAKVPGAGSVVGAGALPRRPAPFTPPPARNSGGGTRDGEGEALAAPPEVSAGGTGSTVTAAVIGLNPAVKIGALPDGSRPAAFSRAGQTGEPASGAYAQGPVISGVAIAGNSRAAASAAPLPVTPLAGTYSRTFELRAPSGSTMSAPLRPSSRNLPRAIEARFRERTVYVLVIPKPNLPDYIADWTMWFSEKTLDSAGSSSMRAPAPLRKTLRADTMAAAGMAGIVGWVQVAAVIGRDGKIASIAPIPGNNPPLAAKAAEDLAHWEFRPASRNGEAIDVEVVIEMPFRVQ